MDPQQSARNERVPQFLGPILTDAEWKTLDAYRRRRSTKGAMAALDLSQSTVEKHLASARRKLAVATTHEAVLRLFGEQDSGFSARGFSAIPVSTLHPPSAFPTPSPDDVGDRAAVAREERKPFPTPTVPLVEPKKEVPDRFLNLRDRLSPATIDTLLVAGLGAIILLVVAAILVLLSMKDVSFFRALNNLTM